VSGPYQDEGNAYARLGEALSRLGRKDEARAAYERSIGQSEEFGHSGMADDLRLAPIGLNEYVYGGRFAGKNAPRDVGYHRENRDV
jgi:hypothetical protein